jgi:hypothetical protein
MSLESPAESGQAKFERLQDESPFQPLSHFSVQIALAKLEFPSAPKPMDEWVSAHGPQRPFMDAYREYLDGIQKSSKEIPTINIGDEKSLHALLASIKNTQGDTIH